MARERRHKSRPRRRRGRFSGLYKFFAVLLVAAAVVTACVVFFRVNQVTVTGNTRYTADEVIAVSGIQTGDNLITLPKSRIAARIRVGLPYIKSVSISQIPPETVELNVTEHAAAAAVADESGGWWLLASRGKLLEQVSDPGEILRLQGLTAIGPVLGDELTVKDELENRREYALSLLEVLENRGDLANCAELDCSTVGELKLQYLNFQVKMPATGDFSFMMAMLDAAFASGRVNREDAGTFDFTVTDGKVYYNRAT